MLGVRMWRRARGWRGALRRTHLVVLAVAAWNLVTGVIAIRGAERSAAAGGGLLGGLGELEVGAGATLAFLAIASLTLSALAPDEREG